jgi:hypothetical protein
MDLSTFWPLSENALVSNVDPKHSTLSLYFSLFEQAPIRYETHPSLNTVH